MAETAVKIHVNTEISYDGAENQTFELTAFGRYYIKGNASYLQYDEHMEEGIMKTIVKVADEEALILRSGAVKMRLPFVLHTKMAGSYETPFGTLAAKVYAKEIIHDYNNQTKQGNIYIQYDLAIQGSPAGRYQLSIKFEEEQS